MAANPGSNVILKIGDGAGTEVFAQAALMKDISWNFASSMVDITNQQSNGSMELLPLSGVKSFDVSFNAIYDVADATGIQRIRTQHLARQLLNIQITDGTETFSMAVSVESIGHSAAVDSTDAVQVAISFKASGAVTIV